MAIPLPVLFLLSSLLASAQAIVCPAPFRLEAGVCIFVNVSQSFSWCDANRLCASMGGELINSNRSLGLLSQMPSANCSCKLWVGVTDLGDERNTSFSGWQLVNGNGILPTDPSFWFPGMPNNNGNQDCAMTASMYLARQLLDMFCSTMRGFVCEFIDAVPDQLEKCTAWNKVNFKRTSFSPSSEYCFTDRRADSIENCVAVANRERSCKQVLYNRKLRTCRMLMFSDAQVEEEIEMSADWVKFSR